MTKEEILRLVIKKAVSNGYRDDPYIYNNIYICDNGFINWSCTNRLHLNAILFSHDFAKAFFGDTRVNMAVEYICADPDCIVSDKIWGYHLQKMVLEDDPLKYLEKFL